VVYELQDRRNSLVHTRDVSFVGDESPIGMCWLMENSLLVFVTSPSAGSSAAAPLPVTSSCIKIVSPSPSMPTVTWPRPGMPPLPGPLIDAAATANGLIALAFGSADGKGTLQLLTMPSLAIAASKPLEGRPQSIILYQPKGSYMAYLSIAYLGGGVEVWELPPASAGQSAVDVS